MVESPADYWPQPEDFEQAPHDRGLEREIQQTWREYRTCSPKQCLFLDALTNQGIFAHSPRRLPHVFFGGGAWGGKSHVFRTASFELNMVLRDQGFPDCWGVILCDTMPNLRDRHLLKFIEEFQGIGVYANTDLRGPHIKFYGEGMGGVYLRYVGDNSRRGTEFAWILCEEVTEWMKEWYETVVYTARQGRKLPFFARGFNSNPDGQGFAWVRDIFVPEYRDATNAYVKAVGEDQFVYIPAVKEDNPAYSDVGYVIEAALAAIEDDDIREARSTGSWDIYGSGRFPKFRKDIHLFTWLELFDKFGIPGDMAPEEFLKTAQRYGFDIYGSLDYATSSKSASVYYLHLVDPHGRPWTFGELTMVGLELEAQSEEIKAFEAGMEVRQRFADPSIGGRSAEREDQRTRQERFSDEDLWFELAVNDRVEGAATMASLLYWAKDENGYLVRPPHWHILKPEQGSSWGCPALIKEIPNLRRDKNNPEDVDKNDGQNHWYDAARYFLHTRFMGGSLPSDPVVPFSLRHMLALGEDKKRTKKGDLAWL